MSEEKVMQETSQEVGQHYIRRVVMECNTSGMDLALGKVVNVKNGVDIFQPAKMQDMTEEQEVAWNAKNFEKGIVTEIMLKSVSSNCPETVTVGLNLFEGTPNIVNSSGWLYAQQNNDMTDIHAHSNEGYTNVVNVLPNEMHRLQDEVIYTPQNVVNNSYINKYGSYTLTKLWENIVPFPGENYYYVDQDHVVMKIIGQNWEQLGIAPEHEQVHEGKYVKVATDVVKNCIKQLYENVIQEIPYTNFKDFGARFQANTEGEEQYKVVCELLVKYKFP
jgi:hypothetical protein|tara:strand:- start:9865 stop:10692 length:828 start_codon:yes stop_codon:yes gene_type:complete